MALTEDLIAAIDARVAWVLRESFAWGVVVSRDSTVDAQVVFDGSAIAVPVKVGGDVAAFGGERVAMVLVGNWWTVVASMTRHWPTDASARAAQTSGGTTSSTTFADLPDAVTATYIKRWDSTNTLAAMSGSAFTNTTATDIEFGLKFVDANGVVTASTGIATLLFDATSAHRTKSDWKLIPGLPAGVYTVTGQWRHGVTGGGTHTVNGYDTVSLHVAEIGP
jgi:hypothetical protein